MRYACIGHRIYFENHFIEGHADRREVRGFGFNHYSWKPFSELLAYAPEATLVFRPELFPPEFVRMVPGLKIGFSSEPLPTFDDRRWSESGETEVRRLSYAGKTFKEFDFFFHYDGRSRPWFDGAGVLVHAFRPLPVDTATFRPVPGPAKEIDFLFVGKPTAYRWELLKRFRALPFRFVWVAHGVTGRGLADLIRRSRCVLNLHADGRTQLEPRVLLAACCGVPVLTEPLGTVELPLRELVFEDDLRAIDNGRLRDLLGISRQRAEFVADRWETIRAQVSARSLVDECVARFLGRPRG